MPNYTQEQIVERIYPYECRIRDLTYAAPIIVDIEYTKDGLICREDNV